MAHPFLRVRPLRILLLLVAGYLLVVGYMAVRQTEMVFPGMSLDPRWGAVPAAGWRVPWDSLRVPATDGRPVFLLRIEAEDEGDAPWILFFHGNGSLVGSAENLERYALLRDLGFQILAMEYRGYGMAGSGTPSEEGLYADAEGVWRHLVDSMRVAPARIVPYGWSLGAGVATRLALRHSPGGLITEGAFTSLPEVARDHYPWLPVSVLLRPRFDNLARADSIRVPWLILHGERDEVVPPRHAEALAEAAPASRRVVLDAGHQDGVVGDTATSLPALRTLVRELYSASEMGAPPPARD